MGTLQEWSEEEWWKRRETGEEFGIPHPDKMAMLVNEICATRIDNQETN